MLCDTPSLAALRMRVTGMVAGLMFGFSFGLGGLGAAALGEIADHVGIEAVYRACSFLPLIGLLTAFLPHIEEKR